MDNLDHNLSAALEYNTVNLSDGMHLAPAEIVDVVATIEGENDGANWHWLVLLKDGRYAYVTGGCDYTGWDCQSNCEAFDAPTLKECVRLIPEAFRDELVEQLPEQTRSAL